MPTDRYMGGVGCNRQGLHGIILQRACSASVGMVWESGHLYGVLLGRPLFYHQPLTTLFNFQLTLLSEATVN